MDKCPYCFEILEEKTIKCPHCSQYFLDKPFKSDYRSVDKKRCIFCGEKILKEATVCRHCHKWLDEIDRAIDNTDEPD